QLIATILPHYVVAIPTLNTRCSVFPCRWGFSPGNPPVIPQGIVQLAEKLTDRSDFVARVDPVDFLDIAKTGAVFRNDPGQSWIHSPGGDHVIAGDVLDLLQ